jgi:hypothetical protein
MKRRCLNPNYHHFEYYGGKGVGICNEWLRFEGFAEWAMQNGYNDNLSLDRINGNGNYCPENCRWADSIVQNNNTNRNHYVEYHGGVYTIAELSNICGIKQNTLLYRIRRGWSVERAVNTPLERRRINA